MSAKGKVRREARDRLDRLSPAERSSASAEIAARIWTLPEMQRARTVLIYAALPSEVATDRIAAKARERGLSVAYPRCFPEGREMSLHLVATDAELALGGRYGIREPDPACPVTRLLEVDLALVPGLGWDRSGHRLGRGAGYYDRLLSSPEWGGTRVGLFFSVQEFPEIPADPWDVRLDAVVTERETVRP